MVAPRFSLSSILCLVFCAIPVIPSPATIDFLGDFHLNLHGHPFETVPEMEKRVKKLVNNGVKFALPYMMPAVTEIQLSSGCTQGFLRLMRGVMDIRDWAFKMVDALGKPSAGILEGTATALGDYDECLEITVPKTSRSKSKPPPTGEAFHGQYCMIRINLPEALRDAAKAHQAGNRSHSVLANSKTFLRSLAKIAPRADIADFRLGACIPSTCTNDDLQAIVNEIAKLVKIEAKVLRCETKHDRRLTTDQIVILTVFASIIALMLAGTTYETVVRFKTHGDVTLADFEDMGLISRFLISFSVYSNAQQLTRLASTTPEQNISCIRGMKFISVCLYVVVSTYATPHDFHFLKYRSVFHFYKFMDEWWFTIFANASAGVDTLFFITGLQITYRLWKKSENSEAGRVRINSFKFIGVWFMRLACIQLLIIALFLCLPFIGKGPIWDDVVGAEIKKCQQRWWMNALFIDSFWPSTETCLTHTWIVSSLMHLLIIGSVIFWILSRCEAVGLLTNVALILGSSVAVAMVTLVNDLPPAPAFYFLSFLNLNRIWDKLFIQAYDHLSPFCVGIMLGYYIARHPKLKLSRTMVALGWTLAVLCNMTVLCGLYGYRHGESMNIILSAIYAAVHRLAWSLGIAWIVFACVYGYGGVIQSLLSWKVFIPLERLSNLTYLLHPLILYLHGGQIREKMYMAHLDQAMYATAYIVFTVTLSGLCYLCFYMPYYFLERNIWYRDPTRSTKKNFLNIGRVIKKKISENNVTCISISSSIEDKVIHRIKLPNSQFDGQKLKT